MAFHRLKFVLLALFGFSVIAGGFHVYRAWAGSETDYNIVYQPPFLKLDPGATANVTVVLQNTSQEIWGADILKLGTVFSTGDMDRPSVWQTASWSSNNRIGLTRSASVYPFRRAEFNFQIQAPERSGLYKEYFHPVLENARWLTGEPIILSMQVGEIGDVTTQDIRDREIKLYRSTQEGEMLESGFVVATLPISSGKSGYTTPAGTYKILNHIENAYSNEYELWMPNWMALSSTKYGYQGYGIHGLPYWYVNPARFEEGEILPGGRLYTQGKLYEGYEHLGIAVSHGCIRFGVKESGVLSSWADNGTLVTII